MHCVFEKNIYLDFEESVVRVDIFDHKRQVIHHYGKDRARDIRVVQNDIIYTKGNRMRIYSMETDKYKSQVGKYDVIFPLYASVKRRRRMFQIRRDGCNYKIVHLINTQNDIVSIQSSSNNLVSIGIKSCDRTSWTSVVFGAWNEARSTGSENTNFLNLGVLV